MSETSKIASHAQSLELAAAVLRKLNKPATAHSCADAAAYLRSLIPSLPVPTQTANEE